MKHALFKGWFPVSHKTCAWDQQNFKMGVGKYKNITYHRIEKVLGVFFNHGRVKMAVGLRYGQTQFS